MVQRFAAVLALLGALTYATLLPWHVTSSFAARSLERDLLSALHVICAPGQATQGTLALAQTGEPDTPVEHVTGCPICKGLAAFQLAVLPSDIATTPVFAVRATFDRVADRAGHPVAGIIPKSRGPPLA